MLGRRLALGNRNDLIKHEFDRFGLILTDDADKQAAWRAQRADDKDQPRQGAEPTRARRDQRGET